MDHNELRELRTLILDVKLQNEGLRLQIKKLEAEMIARHEWLAANIVQPKIEITSPYPELQKLFERPVDDQN